MAPLKCAGGGGGCAKKERESGKEKIIYFIDARYLLSFTGFVLK